MVRKQNTALLAIVAATRVIAFGGILCVSACGTNENPSTTPPVSALLPAPSTHQRFFATPERAVDALVAATRTNQKAELLKIMGADAEKLIRSGDKVADEQSRTRFLAAYDESHKIENAGNNRDVLVVGEEEWPMPIPLVHTQGGWLFDTAAGKEEILNRRIGSNELNVIAICRSYVEAQLDFAAMHPFGDGGHEYAQRFQSSPGKHDGLFWPTTENQPESPLGPMIADATAEGYSEKALSKRSAYHGYFYRILKSQGAHASGGAKDYVVKGHMTGGFALVAFPAKYGNSGVMTFIIGENGIVYEKNLGSHTTKIARKMMQFDPDDSWQIVR